MQRPIHPLFSLILIASLFLVFGCSQDPDQAQAPDRADVLAPATGADKTVIEGSIGVGSTYKLVCPDNWNGDLVIYSHGYAFPETDPALPDADDPSFEELRDALAGMGYGIAFSSYSETGWAVHRAIIESRQLKGLFAASFGMPDKTFLMGKSMGGVIVTYMAERNPGLFDGVLQLCGATGGTDMALGYVYDVRLMFDCFYPGVLPGTAFDIPEGLHWTTVQGLAYMALVSNPMPAFEMAGVDRLNIAYASPAELIEAIIWGLIFHTVAAEDFIDRLHGHDFYDNSEIWYGGSSDDDALNACVVRQTGTRDAEAYLDRWYEPSGKLKIPAVAIHTTRDPVVQLAHMADYQAKVLAAGYGDNLVQHEIDRFGHCTFTLDEILAAFVELTDMAQVTEPLKVTFGD
jgi:pimeloyl-ACP methyl ester carboxylesterase